MAEHKGTVNPKLFTVLCSALAKFNLILSSTDPQGVVPCISQYLLELFNMGKHKAYCWACQDRHFPPTGKKCQNLEHLNSNEDQVPRTRKVAKTRNGGSRESQSSKVFASVSTLNRTPSVTHEMDSHVKRVLNPGHSDQSDSDEGGDSTGEITGSVNNRILAELQKMNARLDMVESQVAGATRCSKQGNQDSELSKTVKSKKCRKV